MGQFEFLRMPFGETGAPKTFVRAMTYPFQDISSVNVFIDDILVSSENLEEHQNDLNKDFSKLKSESIAIRFEKSNFCAERVTYFGLELGKNGIKTTPMGLKKLMKIKKIVQKTKREVQILLACATGLDLLWLTCLQKL